MRRRCLLRFVVDGENSVAPLFRPSQLSGLRKGCVLRLYGRDDTRLTVIDGVVSTLECFVTVLEWEFIRWEDGPRDVIMVIAREKE